MAVNLTRDGAHELTAAICERACAHPPALAESQPVTDRGWGWLPSWGWSLGWGWPPGWDWATGWDWALGSSSDSATGRIAARHCGTANSRPQPRRRRSRGHCSSSQTMGRTGLHIRTIDQVQCQRASPATAGAGWAGWGAGLGVDWGAEKVVAAGSGAARVAAVGTAAEGAARVAAVGTAAVGAARVAAAGTAAEGAAREVAAETEGVARTVAAVGRGGGGGWGSAMGWARG